MKLISALPFVLLLALPARASVMECVSFSGAETYGVVRTNYSMNVKATLTVNTSPMKTVFLLGGMSCFVTQPSVVTLRSFNKYCMGDVLNLGMAGNCVILEIQDSL